MFKVPYKQQEEFLRLSLLCQILVKAHDAGGNGGFLAEAMQVLHGDQIEAVMPRIMVSGTYATF